MVSPFVLRGIKTNVQFFEMFVSVPFAIKISDERLKLVRLSKSRLTYWFFASIFAQAFNGIYMSGHAFHTLNTPDTLTSLQVQQIFNCIVFAFIVFLSLFLSVFIATHCNDCEFLIREGLRIDVDMESKS